MKFSRSTLGYLVLLVVLTVPLCSRIFGSDLIDAHDSMAGLIRALSMQKYMWHGQFLVRWSPEINWGYGYPMFNFYPPFFSFISVLLFQLTHNMVLAINLACSLFWILSGAGMFFLAREFWGDEGGMLSAVLYVYAPYHIVDLYVRGAFAEFSSFAFFPFLLFAILKVGRKAGLGFFLLGVGSVFGLSLTHNIMSMLFFPVAVAFMFYLYYTGDREGRAYRILSVMGMFVIGLMMSSFFWLPALLEKKFLGLEFLVSMRYDFHKNFISLGDLFQPFNTNTADNVSFQVGIIHSLLCLGTLACLPKILKINRRLGLGYVFFLVVGLMAVFFTLPYSRLFWENIGILSFIQFPWRFLAIIVFAMSLLCGSVAVLIKDPMVRKVFLIIVGLLAIFVSFKSSSKPVFVASERTVEDFLAMGEGEYTPKWIKIPPAKRPDRKFEIVRGTGQLGEERSLGPVNYQTMFQASSPCLLSFNTFYFPGWHVYMDGQPIKPYLDNSFGLILFLVPPGNHDIQVIFGQTPVRVAGMIISWLGFVLLLMLSFNPWLRSKLIN